MVRPLPLELDQMIIGFTLDGLNALDRHQASVNLSLVCRAWRDSIDLGKDLIVVGNDNVSKAANYFADRGASGDKRLLIKSAYIQLSKQGSRARSQATARLVELIPNAERVELVAKCYTSFGTRGTGSSLGLELLSALEKLSRVQHFCLRQADQADAWLTVSGQTLQR